MTQQASIPRIRPLVDFTATQIPNPIWRLRYLQAMAPGRKRAWGWKSRKTIGLLTILGLALVVPPLSLRRLGAANAGLPKMPPVLLGSIASASIASRSIASGSFLGSASAAATATAVWPVEVTGDFETYSNGLRIENQYAVRYRPRAYRAFPSGDLTGAGAERRTDPIGIVYHTTESLQAPFEPSQNNVLKRVGESLLEYVRRRRCYNFLIDRFGRVFRIVHESDAADHAGHSVWADDRYFYVNLNDSFIGISFEAQTGEGEPGNIAGNAQVRAAAMLTEMLRSRYKISGGNCVTHAQVSVNPSNMQIGYHVDWASSFPFEKLGLPDNYTTPSPAISLFGFAFDADFAQRAGPRLAAGALEADRELTERAKGAHINLATYRKELHRRYLRTTSGRPS